MLEIKKDIDHDAKEAEAVGLSWEELAVATTYWSISGNEFCHDLVDARSCPIE